MIVYELVVLDRSWSNTIVCKLFVLDKNTWYHINVYKKFIRNNYAKNINVQWTWFPNLLLKNNLPRVIVCQKSK